MTECMTFLFVSRQTILINREAVMSITVCISFDLGEIHNFIYQIEEVCCIIGILDIGSLRIIFSGIGLDC